MKISGENAFKVLLTFILVCLTIKNGQNQTLESKMKGQDILEKTIAYHDPNNNWNSYKGIMYEVTVFADNYVVKETIEINKPDDFYLSTAFQEIGTIKRGMDKGKHFFSLNDDTNISEEIKKNWGLSEVGITNMKAMHTGHFGLPMHLKSIGMKIQENSNIVDFEGRRCYELTFVGMPDLVVNKSYVGKMILYIDAKSYSMRGSRWELSGIPALYVIYSEEIDINGVRIPHIMSCYNVENNIPRYTSINNPYKK